MVPGLAWQPTQPSLCCPEDTTDSRLGQDKSSTQHGWTALHGLEPTWNVYLGEGMACVASAAGATCCWRLWPAEVPVHLGHVKEAAWFT